ncbi:hypothetical protein EHP00_587 [Ecytonucleospora hepatopenaei]|uniref:Uncharacterized protein n=1 Tax=Ecytonucleospora hepatopenaei TaxID=646526 RepID=A0A1W0E7Y5_9MICR|nr:hypothetical protein EHP00_587 [Ecytonucleospora hepatopenaei]
MNNSSDSDINESILNSSFSIFDQTDMSKLTYRQQSIVNKYKSNNKEINPYYKLIYNIKDDNIKLNTTDNDNNTNNTNICNDNISVKEDNDNIIDNNICNDNDNIVDNINDMLKDTVEVKEIENNTKIDENTKICNNDNNTKICDNDNISNCFCFTMANKYLPFVKYMEGKKTHRFEVNRITKRLLKCMKECNCKTIKTTFRYINELCILFDNNE